MTHPPQSAAPPIAGSAVPAAPGIPVQPGRPAPAPGHAPHPSHAPQPPRAPRPRRTAFAEGAEKLRAAATTEPGRLRLIGAVLALLVVAFGAVTAWQSSERAAAADDVLHRSQPLSSGAADIYRSLADANTVASSGFLAGGQESASTRDRYEKDISAAASGLVTAAANAEPGSASEATIARLNRLLPEYKGLIERARTYNRQGYPVGGAYLRYANEKMQSEMLPAAEDLYTKENARLDADYGDATPYPWAAIALGVLTLAGLGWAQRRDYLRTNRVLNHGLVGAGCATVVALLWLTVGHTVARSELTGSYDHGIRSLTVLHDARIASLKARGNENLSLVARGAETVTVGGKQYDTYYYDFDKDMTVLGKGLARAERLADDSGGTAPVKSAEAGTALWKQRHSAARAEDENGDYQQALDKVIGAKGTTGECFDGVDSDLARAIGHEQAEFQRAATSGRDAMTGLPVGAAALAVLGAAGALAGIGRRLSEYR
ncbi:hypothetical protein ACFY5K_33785 [Streptomyces griseofuscus]|uniref:hypothetical protein n=2 Tax=Streptomyces TaxID=1883 RepID=UPI0018F0D1FC|nr:hypothetical protein [Streptomyces sp. CRPSP2-6A1]MBJ7001199.1 hypothetical protein [Streptomyces sp. CRPSP2-6A1]